MKINYLGLEGEIIKSENGFPIRLGFIGCGSHSFRNIYPCLQFLPIELVAICDINIEKAELFKNKFGASVVYKDYSEMIENEKLEAILVVVGFDDDGNPLYKKIINNILKKGIPVWFEKPPAKNSEEIKEMQSSEKIGGSFAQVGFKKMFMPSITKVREIINSDNFGNIDTYTLRYPVDLPLDIRKIKESGPRRFLDDFVHVASTIVTLIGKPKYMFFNRSKNNGAIVTLIHDLGTVGSIHLCPTASEMCPLEQLEIVGTGENIVLDNNITIKYFTKTKRLPYGRSETYFSSDSLGAQLYGPEFSLGQLYNKGLFMLGYYHEIKEFIESVHSKSTPKYANLQDALDVMQVYDAFSGKEGERITVGENIRFDVLDLSVNPVVNPMCPNCKNNMILKDGWNYNCKKCGRMLASSELE